VKVSFEELSVSSAELCFSEHCLQGEPQLELVVALTSCAGLWSFVVLVVVHFVKVLFGALFVKVLFGAQSVLVLFEAQSVLVLFESLLVLVLFEALFVKVLFGAHSVLVIFEEQLEQVPSGA
jgi:hypothetical protein